MLRSLDFTRGNKEMLKSSELPSAMWKLDLKTQEDHLGGLSSGPSRMDGRLNSRQVGIGPRNIKEVKQSADDF